MDIHELKTILDPWLRVDTWHTGHPLDEERFHKALHSAFVRLNTPIAHEYFKTAIIEQVNQRHPGFAPDFLEKEADELALTAERISYYVHNTAALVT
ncbi:hypothetical protein [Lysobacter sp. Hz 25]|uniref:hypothetical protein n=1 Tax=Lysobacter sp. Hz 25 TaxID=3383698 RepID=UPI0038D39EFB